MMIGIARYARLLGSLGRYTLARELSFRGNFLVKVSVEVIWLGILLAFYETIFGQDQHAGRTGRRTSSSSSSAASSPSTA